VLRYLLFLISCAEQRDRSVLLNTSNDWDTRAPRERDLFMPLISRSVGCGAENKRGTQRDVFRVWLQIKSVKEGRV
jgi:hypothetical protein